MKRIFITAVTAALLTVSCQKSEGYTAGSSEGGLRLNLSSSNVVLTTSEGQTGAGMTIDVPPIADFSLHITGPDYDRTWSSVEEYSSDERLTTGTYQVSIQYGDPSEEGLSKPCFSASESVEVPDRNRTVDVTLTAKLANAIVEVAMTDNFKSYFVEHEFTLTTASNTFGIDENPAEHLHVAAPQSGIAIDCECVRQADAATGKKTKLDTVHIDVEPQTRYIVKYDLQNAGSVTVNITLNDETIDSIVIPIETNENA